MADTLPDTGASTWRGCSGRPYPVRIHRLAEFAHTGTRQGVALAVKRDKRGIAKLVSQPSAILSEDWLARAKSAGATEVHVHQPDDASGDPRAIIDDLRGAA